MKNLFHSLSNTFLTLKDKRLVYDIDGAPNGTSNLEVQADTEETVVDGNDLTPQAGKNRALETQEQGDAAIDRDQSQISVLELEGKTLEDKLKMARTSSVPDTLAELADEPEADEGVKMLVAFNTNTLSKTLDKLADSSNSVPVRQGVAQSFNTSPGTLDKLAEDDPDENVRDAARDTLEKILAKKLETAETSTSSKTLAELANEGNVDVRWNVASNLYTSPKTLKELTKDPDENVRQAARATLVAPEEDEMLDRTRMAEALKKKKEEVDKLFNDRSDLLSTFVTTHDKYSLGDWKKWNKDFYKTVTGKPFDENNENIKDDPDNYALILQEKLKDLVDDQLVLDKKTGADVVKALAVHLNKENEGKTGWVALAGPKRIRPKITARQRRAREKARAGEKESIIRKQETFGERLAVEMSYDGSKDIRREIDKIMKEYVENPASRKGKRLWQYIHAHMMKGNKNYIAKARAAKEIETRIASAPKKIEEMLRLAEDSNTSPDVLGKIVENNDLDQSVQLAALANLQKIAKSGSGASKQAALAILTKIEKKISANFAEFTSKVKDKVLSVAQFLKDQQKDGEEELLASREL